MDVTSPITSVLPGVTGVVLGVLGRTDAPLTGRRIAEMVSSSASQSGVNRALQQLTSVGLVHRTEAGSAYLYRLNQDHLAADAVQQLATLTRLLVQRIAEQVRLWEVPARAVWLFGSTARADGGPTSDIDVLVVRPGDVDEDDERWAPQVDSLGAAVHAWTGNPPEIVEHDDASLAALAARGDRLVDDLRRDALAVVGPPPRELLPPRSTP